MGDGHEDGERHEQDDGSGDLSRMVQEPGDGEGYQETGAGDCGFPVDHVCIPQRSTGERPVDWVYLILMLAFLTWSVQMVVAFRRQAARIEEQIAQTEASHREVSAHAARCEAQVEEKKIELQRLQQNVQQLSAREKEVQGQIFSLKKSDAARRPTRHRVDDQGSSGG